MLANATALRLPIPDESAQALITSPPYWLLRDYNVEGQIGLENSVEKYVANLVEFGREAWRVLRDDGTLWITLGDSYMGGKKKQAGLKPKNLIGLPWRVAFALQADGWILRNDVVWHKTNAKPENVTDRFTLSHEYIFLFSKRKKYYFDQDAVREPIRTQSILKATGDKSTTFRRNGAKREQPIIGQSYGEHRPDRADTEYNSKGRNRRTVWDIPAQGFKRAHFACFPPALAEIMVLAGCPPEGLVFDPFCGTGTVGEICRLHNRRFIGFDINFDYLVDFAMPRAEHLTPERSLKFGLFNLDEELKRKPR